MSSSLLTNTIHQAMLSLSSVGTSLDPFPNKPWFLGVCSTSLLKTLGKGEIARSEQFHCFPQYFLPVCNFHKI